MLTTVVIVLLILWLLGVVTSFTAGGLIHILLVIAIVETRPEPAHANKRSWEKEALIIGGSAGAGTAIGAIAGGKKGAGIGAASGGVGGLIFDLITRDKK